MIKPLQLRLGNCIYSPYHGKQMQVEEIGRRFLVLNDEMKLQIWFDDYVFEGIPITREVLEEFGFVCVNEALSLFRKYISEADNESMFLQLHEAGDNPKWQIMYAYKSKAALKRTVMYIHELQNTYYNFAGEELKRKVPVSM